MVQQGSHSIRKTPRKPVVIYVVSPKIIHVKASEFMSLVQRLTGIDSSASSPPPTATATEGELLGDRKTHDCGSPAKPEAIRATRNHFPLLDSVDGPTQQEAADQFSCWRSFFANDLSLTPVAGAQGYYWLGCSGQMALPRAIPNGADRPFCSPLFLTGQFIDVFCRVLPDSRD
ncbi:unnamed protein product [Spirodela intermedia]|uniref:VQ domain-containing protein n=1 Tax=Spirodela intermedia TaxID=51605 RepID=A0A7I8J857_SPIIN|nr:unnamed protein product [Spirodela intermedia]CAA6666408.1 unnamed protein product [Spirodela intermedia]